MKPSDEFDIILIFRHGSCASDLGGSTLTLNPENPQQGRDHNEPFVYRETFANIFPPNNNGNIKASLLLPMYPCHIQGSAGCMISIFLVQNYMY